MAQRKSSSAKNTKQTSGSSSKTETKKEEKVESTQGTAKTEEKPKTKTPPTLSLEQVAMSKSRELSPRFKQEHLAGLLAFCKSSGLPIQGTEKKMVEVLKRYGYKI